MDDQNQSNSNSFPPNNSNDNMSNNRNESATNGKTYKAFGTYNPASPNATQQSNSNQLPQQPEYQQHEQYQNVNQSSDPNYYGQQYQQPGPGNYAGNAQMANSDSGKLKHSGLGITSFILSLVAIASTIIGIIVMVSSMLSIDMGTLELMKDAEYIESQLLAGDSLSSNLIGVVIGAFVMLGSCFFAFLGIIFGIISLFMKQRKKMFGILGTVFNGLLLVVGFFFLIISIASGM